MLRVIQYRFSTTTIAVISGAAHQDAQAARIIRSLRQVGGDINFVGVGGSSLQKQFKQTYALSDALDNHPFEVNRAYFSFREGYQDFILTPYRTYTHYKNYQMIKTLQTSKFFEDLFTLKVDAVVTVGNFSLAKRLGTAINQYCKTHNKIKPFSAHFDRQISERTVENEEFIDYQYDFSGKKPNNAQGYVFPSLCVGYEGLYAAFRHLQQFKADKTNDSFSADYFHEQVQILAKKSRAAFREANKIPEDKYIIYFSPGSSAQQIKFSFTAFKNGMNYFIARDKIKNVDKEYFQIFVPLPADEALVAQIKGKLGYLPEKIKVTLVEEKDRYGAICASDFGFLHNGEVTVEAAACHLPATVVDSMSNVHAYFNNLYNGHASALNVATNYEGYEDICGSLSTTAEKMANIIQEHFEKPKLRTYYYKLYSPHIQRILSKSGTNPQLRVSEDGLFTGCKHLIEKAQTYRSLNQEKAFPKQSLRKQALLI